jgi:hypothetical protein
MTIIVAIIVIMMVAVVFVIPMAFVHLPALLIVVVVGVAPVSAWVGWPFPASAYPCITAVVGSPVAIDPLISFAGDWWPGLVT